MCQNDIIEATVQHAVGTDQLRQLDLHHNALPNWHHNKHGDFLSLKQLYGKVVEQDRYNRIKVFLLK